MVDEALSSEETALIGNCTETSDLCPERFKRERAGQSRFSSRQKILFLVLVYGHTAIFMCVSTPYAFMAQYIVKRGGTKNDATFVLNITLMAMAISSAFFGKYQVNIGTRKLFLGGLLSYVLGQAIFGVLEYAPEATTLVAAGTVIRVLQGFGQGAYVVAALTITCQEFPHNAATAFAILETFASVGYTCGPLLGGILFSVFDALLAPFLISTVLLIPLFPVGMYMVKNYDDIRTDDAAGIGRDFIKKPAVVFLLVVVTSVYGSLSSMGTVLGSLYLISLGFSVVKVGLAILSLSIAYSVVSILVGFIITKGNRTRRFIWSVGILGLCGMPFAFTPTLPQFGAYIAFFVLGILYAFALIASFSELLYLAVCDRPDPKGDFATHSAVSGAWNLVLGFGAFMYPLIGSFYSRYTRFEFVIFADFALGIALAFVAAAIAGLLHYCRNATSTDKEAT